MQPEKKDLELKDLILKGRKQGFLTYSEISDELPDYAHSVDEIDTVVGMIHNMGLQVLEQLPDADAVLDRLESFEGKGASTEPEVPAASTAEDQRPRGADPLRTYMREMATVDLLTREQEVALGRRIEIGIRQTLEALAVCPLTYERLLSLIDNVRVGEARWTEIVVDFAGALADSSLNFELRCHVRNIDNRLRVISDINFAIDKAFREEGISIPFPQRDVHIYDTRTPAEDK